MSLSFNYIEFYPHWPAELKDRYELHFADRPLTIKFHPTLRAVPLGPGSYWAFRAMEVALIPSNKYASRRPAHLGVGNAWDRHRTYAKRTSDPSRYRLTLRISQRHSAPALCVTSDLRALGARLRLRGTSIRESLHLLSSHSRALLVFFLRSF